MRWKTFPIYFISNVEWLNSISQMVDNYMLIFKIISQNSVFVSYFTGVWTRFLVWSCPLSLLNLLSSSANCWRNPSFGQMDRCLLTTVIASIAVMFFRIIKYAKTTVLDRLIPFKQFTSTFPKNEN